jgi:hypothetical protein
MRIIVCGGRRFRARGRIFAVLGRFHQQFGISALIHGAYSGADTVAAEWAATRGVCALPFPADWDKWGRAAGPIRNGQMILVGRPDAVIAFPGGDGTNNMIDQAEKAGITVYKIPMRDE